MTPGDEIRGVASASPSPSSGMGTTADLLAPQAAPHSHEQLHGQGTADARHSGADGYLHSSSTPSSNTPNDQGGRDWHALQDAHSGRPLKVANGDHRLCEVFYFHTDQVGLPEELTNSQGKLCWQASYKTWGNTVKEEWEVQTPSGQKVNVLDEGSRPSTEQNLRFQGQYLDRDTGLHYNTFRFYDPDIGRFISPDPIGLEGGINLGSYSPNPISWIDPWGWNKKFGTGKGTHNATVTVTNSDGSVVSQEKIKSGNMTPQEKALGFPRNTLETHTESRATRDTPLSKGQTMTIDGEYSPCNSCKGKMRTKAEKTGGTVTYNWSENGQQKSRTWKGNC